MPVPVACPSCGYTGQLPDEFTGKTVLCPRCGHALGAGPAALPAAAVPADTPPWTQQFVKMLADHSILAALDAWPAVAALPAAERGDAPRLAQALARKGKLTWYQAALLSQGKAAQLVLGNYVLLDKVGEGGFGTVFKARHRRMQRVVALKVLLPEVTRDPQALQRFQREVETTARLSHPNIVTAFDADEARGAHFLAMELVDGPDLGRLLKKQGPLALERAVDYVIQAARGLGHAHAAGIIHRDVKPSNLLLDRSGVVKVSDLGLARVVQPEGGSGLDQLTATRNIMGTVDYMAPEQALSTRNADQRADIYSLGCTLYTLLTARPLYAGDTALAIVLTHREAPIPPLPAPCGSLQDIFARMVAKRPEDRYPSMAAVEADLEKHVPIPAAVATAPRSGSSAAGDSRPMMEPATALSAPAAAPATGTESRALPLAQAVPAPRSEPGTQAMTASALQPPAPSQAGKVGEERPSWLLSVNEPAPSQTGKLGEERPSWLLSVNQLAPSRGSKRWWVLGGAGAAALLLAVLGVGLLALTRRGKTDTASPEQGTSNPATAKTGEITQPVDVHALIRQCVQEGKVRKTDVVGGAFAKGDFEELPADGGIIIGFEVGLGRFVANDTIGYLRPIYQKDGAESLGAEIGKRPDKVVTLKARKGYAVGGVRIKAGGVLDGLAVTFMRRKDKFLDPTDAYDSDWVGGGGSRSVKRVGGDGSLMIGIFGKTLDNGQPGRLGFIFPTLPTDWIVFFRSDDPKIWNDDVNHGPNHFARSLQLVPASISYLKMTNTRTDEFVIIEMTSNRLRELSHEGKYGWEGRNIFDSNAHHLGVTDVNRRCQNQGEIAVSSGELSRGWGFGHGHFVHGGQCYSWDGKEIPQTVFEIAVKAGDLTKAEARKLLKAGVVRD